eukprot:1183357-Prorocentrum_minimum.AAC.1
MSNILSSNIPYDPIIGAARLRPVGPGSAGSGIVPPPRHPRFCSKRSRADRVANCGTERRQMKKDPQSRFPIGNLEFANL